MPDEIKPEPQRTTDFDLGVLIGSKKSENRTGLYLLGIGCFIMFSIIAFSLFTQSQQPQAQPTQCDLFKEDLNKYFSMINSNQWTILSVDTNQHQQLAQLIVQNNYLMQCTIDTNSFATVEVPLQNGAYKKFDSYKVYCPQGKR